MTTAKATGKAGGSKVGKFGIGVRVVDDEGDVGVIVGKRKGERQIEYDRYGKTWWPKGLLAVAANDNATTDTPSISPEIVVNDYSGVTEGGNSSEWVPKVGDRVDDPAGGGMATVSEVRADGKFTVTWDTGCVGEIHWRTDAWTFVSRPLPVAEQPAAEVANERAVAGGGFMGGDRIRLIDGEIDSMPLGSEYVAIARTRGAEMSVHFMDGDGDETWRPGAYFELVTPLTIEAGKSYRTRDGRKADVLRDQGGWLAGDIVGGEQGKAWNRDGSHGGPYVNRIPSHDLVAEWVEPAAGVAVVEVVVAEATATEQPKFKASDKVRALKTTFSGDYKAGEIYEVRETLVGHVKTVRDSFGSTSNGWGDHNFELATHEPATTEAKFKVGDRVRANGGYSFDPSAGTVVSEGDLARVHVDGQDDVWNYLASELAPLTTPTFARNDLVTLAAPVKVNGMSGDRVHISFPNGGSFTLPASALIAA